MSRQVFIGISAKNGKVMWLFWKFLFYHLALIKLFKNTWLKISKIKISLWKHGGMEQTDILKVGVGGMRRDKAKNYILILMVHAHGQ